jgi:ABC-2 type transport system permease protein
LANLPTHSDYYGFASILLFIFAATVGPEMLSPDRKNGVISLYLVRPLTTTDYVISRWAAFFTVMLFVAWLPQTVLLVGLALGASEPAEYMKDNWLDVPRYLVSGAAIALYTTTLAMLVASYTTRRAMAAAFLIGLFVISAVFTSGLAESLDNTTGDWISMFNLANIPMHVNDWVFDATSDFLANEPSLNLPQWVRVVWFLPWTVIPFALMWRRYRNLAL